MKSILPGLAMRAVAIVSLFLALFDTARVLGVADAFKSPMLHYGVAAFMMAAALTLVRLFASVGLWIGASWGGVLLVAGTAAELASRSVLPRSVRPEPTELFVRLVLAIAIAALFGVKLWKERRVHE